MRRHELLILNLDLDCTSADTEGQMQEYFRKYRPEFADRHFNLSPGEERNPDFEREKSAFMRKSEYIPGLQFYSGFIESLPDLCLIFDLVYMNTARRTDQRPSLKELMKAYSLSRYFNSMLLRPTDNPNPNSAKIINGEVSCFTDAADDDGNLARVWSEEGKRVALIAQPWTEDVQNNPNLRKYCSVGDYVADLIFYGGPEKLFAVHAAKLTHPEELYKIHKAPVPRSAPPFVREYYEILQ